MSDMILEDDAYTKGLSLSVWRRLAGRLGSYKKELYVLVGGGFVVALCEVFLPVATGRMIDESIRHGWSSTLMGYAIWYASMWVAIAIGIFFFIDRAGRLATGIAYDLRRDGFQRLQELSFSYYDVRPTGWLVTRLTSDCSRLSSMTPWFLLDMAWGCMMLLGIVLVMLWLHWKLAIVVMTVIPMLVLVSLYFQRKLLGSSRLVRKTNSQMTASFTELANGAKTTKTLVREGANLEEFQELSHTMRRYSVSNALQSALYLPMVSMLGSIGVGLALWQGGLGVLQDGTISLGLLVSFMQFAVLLYHPIQEMSACFAELQMAQAAAERIQELLDTTPDILDSPDVQEALSRKHEAGLAPDGYPERIENLTVRDVTFAYKAGEPVLRDVNLDVKRGETIALVGATGSGKSTIVSVLSRFYEPSEGAVLLDGVDYRKRSLYWFQAQLGVVLQTPHLFTGTIRDNIRYGKLSATDQEVEEAARQAGVDTMVAQMPEGYDTQVGEGGQSLSVGQRQLVSLARAILSDPQIFIMDEATSSVDTETEQLIQSGIETLLEGRIAFVIAHRLSTIRNADRILVIDKGQIVESGNHMELMRLRGRYFGLYSQQRLKELADEAQPFEAREHATQH
jgi:ATP-binding cassette subfamily B protein